MTTAPLRVLVVEDNPGDAQLVRVALGSNDTSFDVDHVERVGDAVERLGDERPDAVILDLNLPDSQGLDTFRRLRDAAPDMPVVILTVVSDEESAVEAVRLGAQDYLYKTELMGRALPRVVRYAIERHVLREQLAGVTRELHALLAHAAHDLRTPVAIVAGVADVLRDDRRRLPDAELDELLTTLRRQSRRLGDLVADLMDVARSNRDVELAAVDVDDVVRSAVETLPPPGHVQLSQSLDGGGRVGATPSGLQRIVTNLLSNAYAYADGRVAVSVRGDADTIAVVVEDDGRGVPDQFVDQLFEDFMRGPNARERDGTGLGLAIVRRLAHNFGGRVDHADSDHLGGARFVVSLPRWDDARRAR